MPVSKRLRFEVLRRDNFSCRYCGDTAPDVKLTVDHVVPTALGGKDEPTNLVTACQPCNAGKSSMPADATVVSDVAQDAIRWRDAMAVAAQAASADLARMREYRAIFSDAWHAIDKDDDIWRPPDWADTLDRFYEMQVPPTLIVDAVRIAMRSKVTHERVFRYFCGVVWKRLGQMQDAAHSVLASDEAAANGKD